MAFFIIQLAETKAYKKQNLGSQTITSWISLIKLFVKNNPKKAFKITFKNRVILAVAWREKCVFQRVYPVFIFSCKSGGVFFSSFYVSDLSYTVPSIVFLDFRAVFNLYIKVVLRCFFTCDRLSCLRRRLKRISR